MSDNIISADFLRQSYEGISADELRRDYERQIVVPGGIPEGFTPELVPAHRPTKDLFELYVEAKDRMAAEPAEREEPGPSYEEISKKYLDEPQAIPQKAMLGIAAGLDEALKYPLAVAKKFYDADTMPGPSPDEISNLLSEAVDFWKSKIPDQEVPGLAVAWSDEPVPGELAHIGKLRLFKRDVQARERTEAAGRFAGFAAPASAAIKAAAPVEAALEPFAREGFRKVASRMVAGSFLGEGEAEKSAEMAAAFGLFEAVPVLARVVRDKYQRAKLMREWRAMPDELKVPVAQNLEETLRKNPHLSEADAVRMSSNYMREAVERRRQTEAATTKPEERDVWGTEEEWAITPKEERYAERVREDAGQVYPGRDVAEGGEGKGRTDLELPAPEQPGYIEAQERPQALPEPERPSRARKADVIRLWQEVQPSEAIELGPPVDADELRRGYEAHVEERSWEATTADMPVEPPHEPTSPEKVEALARSMESVGWRGRPVLVVDRGDHYQAITGSHRIAAAEKAGIEPRIYPIEAPESSPYKEPSEEDELWGRLLDARDDDDVLAILRELAAVSDDSSLGTAVDLMREEIAANDLEIGAAGATRTQKKEESEALKAAKKLMLEYRLRQGEFLGDKRALGAFKANVRRLAKKTPASDEMAVMVLDNLATRLDLPPDKPLVFAGKAEKTATSAPKMPEPRPSPPQGEGMSPKEVRDWLVSAIQEEIGRKGKRKGTRIVFEHPQSGFKLTVKNTKKALDEALKLAKRLPVGKPSMPLSGSVRGDGSPTAAFEFVKPYKVGGRRKLIGNARLAEAQAGDFIGNSHFLAKENSGIFKKYYGTSEVKIDPLDLVNSSKTEVFPIQRVGINKLSVVRFAPKKGKIRVHVNDKYIDIVNNTYKMKGIRYFTDKDGRFIVVKHNNKPVAIIATMQGDIEFAGPSLKGKLMEREGPQRARQGTLFEEGGDKAPPGGPPPGEPPSGRATEEVQPILELPELVELVEKLTGKAPIAKGMKPEVHGYFKPKEMQVFINRLRAQDINEAVKTLSHELGHVVDYYGETVERGNVLGHIARLKNYLKQYLAEKPGAPGPLTPEEIEALKREARAILEGEVSQTIRDELGIEPEAVLNFLRGVNQSDLPKWAEEYIKQASSEEKKSIAKQAMKGLEPEELRIAAGAEETGTSAGGKKITRADVERKFRELLKEEIRRRKLWSAREIKQELRWHTRRWRPWEEGVDIKYDAYRDELPELVADALSALITHPAELQKNAPKFYRAFLNWLETRPEFKQEWEAIQERIRQGPEEVSRHRIKRVYEDMEEGYLLRQELDKARQEKRGEQVEKISDTLARGLIDKYHYVNKFINKAEKKGGPLAKRARALADEILKRPLTPSAVDAYLHEFKEQVLDPMRDMGVDKKDVAYVGSRLHIIHNRDDIFNPRGATPETAEADLDQWVLDHGEDYYEKVLDVLKRYRALREKRIIPLIIEKGLASKALQKAMRERKHYLRVSVLDYLDDDLKRYGGKGTSLFFRQKGTFKGQEDAIDATVLDDVAAIYLAYENDLRRQTVKLLRNMEAAKPAPMKVVKLAGGKHGKIIDERAVPNGWKALPYREEGKLRWWLVPEEVAKAIRNEPHHVKKLSLIFNAIDFVMKELFVGSNIKWAVRNIPRDFWETVTRNPREFFKNPLGLPKEYVSAFKEALDEIYKGKRSERLQKMYWQREIPTRRIWSALDASPGDEITRLLRSYGHLPPDTRPQLYEKTIKKFFESHTVEEIVNAIEAAARKAWREKEKVGRLSELPSKIAGRGFLEKSGLPEEEISRRVITDVGTPNWLERGEWHEFTNKMFLYSTIAKAGLRAQAKAAKRDPLAYVAATAMLAFAPAVLDTMAEHGFFGEETEKIMRGIPKWYKNHYFIVPLFRDRLGKSHFLAIPIGSTHQAIKAVTAAMLDKRLKEIAREVYQAQPYQHHPLVGEMIALIAIMLGINPVSSFTGRPIVRERAFELGGKPMAEDVLRDAWKSLGLDLIYRIPSRFESKRQTKWEKFLRTPVIGSAINAIYKVSDAGWDEYIEEQLDDLRREANEKSLKTSELLQQKASDYDEAMRAYAILRDAHDTRHARQLIRAVASKWGNPWARALAYAKNDDERAAILMLMRKEGERTNVGK